jgi:hypothetical protein
MRFIRALQVTMLVVALAGAGMTMSACEKKGPAQDAGEKLDKAKDKIDDAVNPKGPLEKAGRAVDRATGN